MDAIILDRQFQVIGILDVYQSFIWTERRLGYGDFELYLPLEAADLNILRRDNYVSIRDSEVLMIIESIEIDTDAEEGDHVTVTGRSLESLLSRRVIWGQATLSAPIQNVIEKLLKDNVISPSIPSRRIANFEFKTATEIRKDPAEVQFFGDNLYDAIYDLCDIYGIYFTIREENGRFIFSLHESTDRSYRQEKNPYVVFSTKYENLAGSNVFESAESYHNAALVAGEGEGYDRVLADVDNGDQSSDLDRREIYIDGSDISQKAQREVYNEETEEWETEEYTLEPAVYIPMLQQKGDAELEKESITSTFEGRIETNGMFAYGEDYFIGDIVQVVNEYGLSACCRVSEVVRTVDEGGDTTLVTFENVE